MKMPLSLLLTGVLLMGCTAPRLPQPQELVMPPLVFKVPQVDQVTLANGMRVYLKEDHELPLVAVTVMLGGGTVNDPAGQSGRAELLARTLRTGGAGNRTPDQVDELLARMAADFNVGADTYALTANLSLLADDLESGLELLADTLRRPTLAPERLELARRQMLETIRRQNDHPAALAGRALLQGIYGTHPLGRQASETSVNAISRADLQALHTATVQPGNLWLAISGDFDTVRLLAELERLFGDWPRNETLPQELPPVTTPPHPAVIVANKDVPQTVVQLGVIGIDKSAPDLEAVRVMNYILGGGGFGSRLMDEIRVKRGLAYSVQSYFQVGRRLPGPFIAQCETKNASALETVQLMLAEIARMRTEPVAAEELHSAKESLVNSFVFSFTHPHEVVTQALRLDFYGYPAGYLEDYRARVEAVTVADVQQAAQKRLHPEQMTIVLVGKEEELAAGLDSLGRPVERFAP